MHDIQSASSTAICPRSSHGHVLRPSFDVVENPHDHKWTRSARVIDVPTRTNDHTTPVVSANTGLFAPVTPFAFRGQLQPPDLPIFKQIHATALYEIPKAESGNRNMGFEEVRGIEDDDVERLRASMELRAEQLGRIDPEAVRLALYGLVNAPSNRPSPSLAVLSRTLGHCPSRMSTMVDDESNPWSEFILLFIDTFLILYSPVSDAPIPLRGGYSKSGENDETDQKAFGALTATSLAPRILMLIPHAHHHVLKALWFALIYLSIAFWRSKRGVAVEFLIDRVYEEWSLREERAKSTAVPCWGIYRWEKERENEWYKRARRVGELRIKCKHAGGVSMSTVWREMKGLVRTEVDYCGERSQVSQVVEVVVPSQASDGGYPPDTRVHRRVN